MRVSKMPMKALFVLSNPVHMKKGRTGEFAILLSVLKNETTPLRVILPEGGEGNRRFEIVEERVSKSTSAVPPEEVKDPSSPIPSVVKGREKEESSVEDRKLLERSQRNRGRRSKDEGGSTDPYQVFSLLRPEQSALGRSVSRRDSVTKSDGSGNSEFETKTRTEQNSVMSVSDQRLRDRVAQHLKFEVAKVGVDHHADDTIVEMDRGREESHERERISVSEELKTSIEGPISPKPLTVDVKNAPTKGVSFTSSSTNTTPMHDAVAAEIRTMVKEDSSVERTLSTMIVPKESEEKPFFRIDSESGKASENHTGGSNRIFTVREENAYVLKKEENVMEEIVKARVPVEQSLPKSFPNEEVPPVREELSLKDRRNTAVVPDRKSDEVNVLPSIQHGDERKAVESALTGIENGESAIRDDTFLRTLSRPQDQAPEREAMDYGETSTFPIPSGRVLNDEKNLENFQGMESDTHGTEVPIFYEKSEKLESFKEVFSDSLSELIQRGKAQEVYVIQGPTRNEETVPTYSIPRIVERMYVQKQERAVMTLNPPELGRVEVVIEKSGEEVRVTLKVYTEEAKNSLEREVPQLVDRLSERGLDVRVQIEKQEGRDLLQGEDRRERRQRERRSSRTGHEDFSETMREVVG